MTDFGVRVKPVWNSRTWPRTLHMSIFTSVPEKTSSSRWKVLSRWCFAVKPSGSCGRGDSCQCQTWWSRKWRWWWLMIRCGDHLLMMTIANDHDQDVTMTMMISCQIPLANSTILSVGSLRWMTPMGWYHQGVFENTTICCSNWHKLATCQHRSFSCGAFLSFSSPSLSPHLTNPTPSPLPCTQPLGALLPSPVGRVHRAVLKSGGEQRRALRGATDSAMARLLRGVFFRSPFGMLQILWFIDIHIQSPYQGWWSVLEGPKAMFERDDTKIETPWMLQNINHSKFFPIQGSRPRFLCHPGILGFPAFGGSRCVVESWWEAVNVDILETQDLTCASHNLFLWARSRWKIHDDSVSSLPLVHFFFALAA